MVLGSVEYIDPLNTPCPIPVVYGEEVGEIPTGTGVQMGLVGATHPQGFQSLFSSTLTPSGWKQE